MFLLIRSVKFYFHIMCFEAKLRVGMNNLKYFNLIIFRLYWRFANAVYFSNVISFFSGHSQSETAQKLQLILFNNSHSP